jgi:hypothetical protein
MPERPCPHALEVPVTADEFRSIARVATTSGETIGDFLRQQLGLVPEHALAEVRARCERELSRTRLRRIRR